MPVIAPAGRTTTHRLGRPSFVNDGLSWANWNRRTFTKKSIAAS
jgi:hypothetical protein